MIKLAIVAYYYGSGTGVGALRPFYWAEHINEIDKNIFCDVITAQEVVENRNLPGGGKVITIKDEQSNFFLNAVKIDAGAGWSTPLRNYFFSLKDKYDIVIFTGGPFLHFFTAKVLKKKFKSKIVFDFRDPFANNPNHKLNFFKRFVKRVLERKMLKIADISITVNQFCKDLMEKDSNTRVEIIDNGFDDSMLFYTENFIKKEKHKIVYAGKFYKGAPPDNLLNALKIKENILDFDYMGADYEKIVGLRSSNFSVTGPVDYKEAVKRIASADTGVILTGGEPFESTTKVFDYIGLEKNVLIITNGKLKTGNLHEITKEYPNVFWVNNNEKSIGKILDEIIENKPKPYPEKERFSRRAGLIKLVDILLTD
jgi:hypothetical protein